jgi:hypothetical protein
MDFARAARGRHHDFDPGAKRRAIRFLPGELYEKPVVRIARIGKHGIEGSVAQITAADVVDDVLKAVVVQIGKRDRMSFLQMPKTAGGGDVLERFAIAIMKHLVRHKTPE